MNLIEFAYEGERFLLNLKQASVSLAVGEREVYAFDLEGRPHSFWMNGQTFVWTLDSRVIKKWWRDSEHPRKQIQEADTNERRTILEKARARLAELHSALQRGSLQLDRSGDSQSNSLKDVETWLSKSLAWDNARLEKQRRRFDSVYSPVGILPPDQYLALVLQVTHGCHWNQCTFCDFYRKVSYHIKSMEELEQHLHAVRQFFGDGIFLRRSIFLGDANALILPQNRLLRIFDRINQEFAFAGPAIARGRQPRFEGISSFLDVFAGGRKSVKDFRELKARHLRRLYIGVETGCDPLLAFLNKPSSSAQALELVGRIKSAGLGVGVIVLVGPGGDRFADAHLEQTTALLRKMTLGAEDVVYLAPLLASPYSQYVRRAREARIRPLTPVEIEHQMNQMKASLTTSESSRPNVARYDVREFVY
jgi:hypothetical protein